MSYTCDWFSNNIGHWQKLLVPFIGKEDLNFLEIGCFEGKATHWLCSNILTGKNCSISVVDTFGGSMEHKERNFSFDGVKARFLENTKQYEAMIKIYQMESQKMLREINASIFDFIYVDGSHTAPDVLEDAILSWRLLKPQGIMIFDDYAWDAYKAEPEKNPRLAIDSFLAVMKNKYELLHKEYQVAIKKTIS